MSKSKGNVVNPDEYFKQYGADTVRMYLMFLGPFAQGGDWSDKGIVGVYRFLNRVWAFCARPGLAQKGDAALEVLRQKTIKKVTEDLENLRYNTAISALMEYLNEISVPSGHLPQGDNIPISKQYIETLLVLLAPFAPYITEELWPGVHNQSWPKYNPKMIQEEKTRFVLQANGKVRDIIEVASGISEAEAKKLALANPKIKKWLQGKLPKRIIFVPQRLIN